MKYLRPYSLNIVTIFISISSVIVALVGVALVWKSNVLIENQNSLIRDQNTRIDQQTYLQEAQRRSSYMFLLSSIYEQISMELNEDYLKNNIRDLSPQTVGAIGALTQGLKPYRLLEGDSLSKDLSPERGQVLAMLISSRLDKSTYKSIYGVSDFSYSDLRGISLAQANLKGIHLNYANLYGVNLYYADLSNSELFYTSLNYAILVNTNLTNTNLMNADLDNAFVSDNFMDSIVSMNRESIDLLNSNKTVTKSGSIQVGISTSAIVKEYEVNMEYEQEWTLGEETYRGRKLFRKSIK